jgi:hypothetical protein
MRRADAKIAIAEVYKGVGVHADQPRERIERVVRPEIDRVLGMTDSQGLFALCGDVSWSPEARMLAGAMLEALWDLAVNERRERPKGIDLDVVRARVGGLNSANWRSRTHYCCLLDPGPAPGQPGPVPREVPLTDD